jgi:hypothetical protein
MPEHFHGLIWPMSPSGIIQQLVLMEARDAVLPERHANAEADEMLRRP